ncbi:Hypothetical protein D9617_9g023840 [Elsinoe fawcettii]|nr:Hypothetical protein D9617_9g023840 [Elsinoe fawcettii]
MDYNDYHVGWICALATELAAAMSLLDEDHPALPARRQDDNVYVLGRLEKHNIVIASLPAGVMGVASASRVAERKCVCPGPDNQVILSNLWESIVQPGCYAWINMPNVSVDSTAQQSAQSEKYQEQTRDRILGKDNDTSYDSASTSSQEQDLDHTSFSDSEDGGVQLFNLPSRIT